MKILNRWLELLLPVTASLILFSMMTYTFIDVGGRYLFNAPLPGGLEVTELMMAILIFAGLPLVTAADQHVSIDILDGVWPAWFRRIQRAVVPLISAVVSAVLCWRVWVKAQEASEYHDVTAAMEIPLAPFIWFMAAMMAMTALYFLAQSLSALARFNENKGSH